MTFNKKCFIIKIIKIIPIKKFFIFLFIVIPGVTMAQTPKPTTKVTWHKNNPHHSTPIFTPDSIPGRIYIPSPMFLACQDDYAVIDTDKTVLIDSMRYVFVGNVATLPQCCYHEDGSLLISHQHILSPIEVLNSLTWRKMYFGRPFKTEEGYVGNYVPVYVWEEELKQAGLIKG